MAQQLDDGEFWLPSEFLTDDDLLMDFKNDDTFGRFNSDLCSPVESVTDSTETESDEDELISRLTREMANSTLNECTAKDLKLSGSPQSTLCSLNNVSRFSSPSQVLKEDSGWDFLCAAAEEASRFQRTDETALFHSAKPESVKKLNQVTGYYPCHAETDAHLAYLKIQANHFQRLNQQQMMKLDYQFQNGKIDGLIGRNKGLSTAAWPTLQQSQRQQTGSGMRSGFIGEIGAKKERTGTGVFLPRRIVSNTPEIRDKTDSTTVLIPKKVVHALNLNLDTIGALPHPKSNRNFIPEYDAGVMQRNNFQMMNQELRLPQEWTY